MLYRLAQTSRYDRTDDMRINDRTTIIACLKDKDASVQGSPYIDINLKK